MLKRFLSNLNTIILSLLLAAVVWYIATQEENPPLEADFEQGIPLEIVGPIAGSGLILVGDVPDHVTLRLRGPKTSWEALTPEKFRTWIDLSTLSAGLHQVPVQVEAADRSLRIIGVLPAQVSVRLEEYRTRVLSVEPRVLDAPALGYIHRAPEASPPIVTVSGPASLVDRVAYIDAEIALQEGKESVSRSVDVSPRDATGNLVRGITLNPPRVSVTVPVEQRFGYRDVSISAVITGQVAAGYWVSNILVAPATLTLIGAPAALNQLTGFVETDPVDVSGATQTVEERAPLNLPPGTSVALQAGDSAENARSALVRVEVSAIEGGQTVEREVVLQGIGSNRWALSRPETVDVIISGPLPRLQALRPGDVRVIVDVFGLTVGTHKVTPAVITPPGLRIESVLPEVVEVQIGIGRPPTPTPTPAGQEDETPEPTATTAP